MSQPVRELSVRKSFVERGLPITLGSSHVCTRLGPFRVHHGLPCWQHVDGNRWWRSRRQSEVELGSGLCL